MISGLEIFAFPCNQFLKQEPGTSQEAEEFACTRYKAEYPIFQKVVHTLYHGIIIYAKNAIFFFFLSINLTEFHYIIRNLGFLSLWDVKDKVM